MFWGLIMEPQRRYTQKVKKAFHISMAALDISTSSEEPAQVMCGFEGRNYLLCTLKKPEMLQCPLDLNFEVGSELSFAANGKCHVHLTGYLIEEPMEDMEELEEEESEQESEEEVEISQKKRRKQKNGPPAKKSKLSVSDQTTGEEDSGSENSDVDIGTLLENTLESDDDDATFKGDEEDGEEEQSAEDSDDDEDDDDEDDDEDAEEEESSLSEAESEKEEVEKSPKKKSKQLNGVAKPEASPKAKKEQVKTPEQKQKAAKNDVAAKTPKKKELNGGVVIEDIKEGDGAPAKAGKFVNVYYEGRLKQNNKVFDATKKGAGFSFRLGAGEVIKGWDVGVVGMKPGGKRRIICPPAMAYGQKGSPPAIPGNSTLVFEVELKKIR